MNMFDYREGHHWQVSGSQQAPADLQRCEPRHRLLPAPGAPADLEQLGTRGFWGVLWRARYKVVAFVLAGCAAGGLVTLLQPPRYRASALIEMQSADEATLQFNAVLASLAREGFSVEAEVATSAEILRDDQLLRKVVKRLNLATHKEYSPPEGLLAAFLAPDRTEGDGAMSHAVSIIRERLRITPIERSRIIRLEYASSDPQLAASVPNVLAESFVERNLEQKQRSAEMLNAWLIPRLREVRTKLDLSQRRLRDYSRRSGLMLMRSKDSLSEKSLQQIQEEQSRARADRISKQSLYETTAAESPGEPASFAESSVLKDLQIRLADLRRQQAELASLLKPQNYKVVQIRAQVEEIEASIKAERARILGRLKNDYLAALEREQMLTAAYAKQQGVVADESNKSVGLEDLQREVELDKQLYGMILQKANEVGVSSTLSRPDVRLAAPALTPAKPYSPRPLANSAVGMFLGLLIGTAVVSFRAQSDYRLRVPGETALWLGIPELGAIPKADFSPIPMTIPPRDPAQISIGEPEQGEPCVAAATVVDSRLAKEADGPPCVGAGPGRRQGGTGKGSRYLRRLLAAAADRFHSRRSARGEARYRVELATWNYRSSAISECVRATLSSVLYSPAASAQPSVLAITSALPEEGKTVVASNLAIALAEIGRRVLLIDADFRRPGLSRIFGVTERKGLSHLLEHKLRTEMIPFEELGVRTMIPNLFLLPVDADPTHVTLVLHSPRLPQLLRRLRTEFDYVLIDTPPTLLFAEARVLGKCCDAALLVVRSGHTSRNSAAAAAQRLEQDGVNLLGVVLNGWDPNAGGDSLGYSHYRKYYRSK